MKALISELIDIYQFDYISTRHRTDLENAGCCSMVEEMNDIRQLYKKKGNIDDVLKKCVCNRHGHQYCIPEDAVNDAVIALKQSMFINSSLKEVPFIQKNRIYEGFIDFEELYDFIHSVIGNINGIGPLTIYDTARRIGHLFKSPIYPEMYVYLSAGAKEAAEHLLNKKPLKFREPICLFTPFFGTFPSIFIEDILCIFKDKFINPQISITKTQSNACGIFNHIIKTIKI